VSEAEPTPQNATGDRVLVLKPLYHLRPPERGDVVVFKFPEKPQERHTAQNYIKRAMAFGGETVAIHRGDLFVTRSLDFPSTPLDGDTPDDLWKPRYMYPHVPGSNPPQVNEKAAELFDASRASGFEKGKGGFEVARKGEDQLLADRRIVWDNDKQPKELAGRVPPRWYAPDGDRDSWKGDDPDQPKAFAHDKPDQHWIRYRHLATPWRAGRFDDRDPVPVTEFANPAVAAELRTPRVIDNFLGYNAGRDLDPATNRASTRDNSGLDKLWVGDLILECQAELGSGAEVTLELSKGVNRFQAVFGDGKVTLRRTGPGSDQFGEPSRPCKVSAGKHTLRFANVDCRLWVWVDGNRIDFGTDGDYQPATPDQEAGFVDTEPDGAGREVRKSAPGINPEGWTRANDVLAPASIGARGQVTVRGITLHRDVYYTRSGTDHGKADIYYVQPGHTLCLGDNSAQSSDSRKWGTVPDRLLLGKAVFVFWPAWPNNRIGFIK
jgi:signal peptidase I